MKVGIIMGSSSDFPVVEKSVQTLKKFGITPVVKVMSAHRTPDEAADFAKNADKEGIEVIIAAAGKAAHLPGVIAAFTTLPVIGIPIHSKATGGIDALYSIVQMPAGIPVATVAIDGAENAALLAVQIMQGKYESLKEKLIRHKEEMKKNVMKQNCEIQTKINEL